ncbi:RHS repeat domain-containing protein [Undibacterium sp.]|uniref:RHS repeat domain-containing protein n=1 Tax=Undibacterium sp. TaxID=1914977 RepID=UPI00272FFFE3|nr:hypothetical protein [Undibacterium sp.]MDP1978681.1 hypothetical protein [Undibacterium sp.]
MSESVQDGTRKTTAYTYDVRGNKTLTETFLDEQTSSIAQTLFNTRNRPISIQDALCNTTTIHNFERHPNPLGGYLFSKTTTDPLGNQAIEVYDPLGRQSTVEKRNIANQRLSYQSVYYDPAGNKELLQEVIYASGIFRGSYAVDWTHDSMGRPLVTTERGSDDSHKITKHSYDQSGRLQTITKPDGITLNHTYDSLGRLKQLTSSDSTISYLYEYDLNDNLLTSTDCLTNTATQRCYDPKNRLVQETLANGLVLAFTYDDLYQLTSESGGESHTYAYDSICNRLSKDSLPYNVNGLNQVTAESDIAYHYDLNGNLIAKSTPTESYCYSYDALNRMISTEGPYGKVTYTYDSFGRRLRQLHNLTCYANQDSTDSHEILEKSLACCQIVCKRNSPLSSCAEIAALVFAFPPQELKLSCL